MYIFSEQAMINFPGVSFDSYRELPFSQFHFNIFRFGWLDSSFNICRNFITLNLMASEKSEGRIKTVHASEPGKVSYEEHYIVNYFPDEEHLYIHFLNDRFKVESIKLHDDEFLAAELTLRSSLGKELIFYGTKGEPFTPAFNQRYGIVTNSQ